MRRIPTAAAFALLLVVAGVAGVVSADSNSNDNRPAPTTAEVTGTATDAPVAFDGRFEQRLAHRLAQFDLTDAQTREVVTEASRLHEAGASRLVIRSSVVMHLYEFGVDAPFLYAGEETDRSPGAHAKLHRFVAGLDVTPAQVRELHATVHRMYDDGATRMEIRRAVRRQLAAWDVDRPGADGRPDAVDRFVDRLADRHDLTDRQAAEVERLVRRMLDSGAHRGEIREAVGRLLDSYDEASPRDADRRTAADRPT